MTRPRNNFSIPKHGKALYAVLTFAAIRDMRPALGPLNARMGRYIRRFVLPVSTGSGPGRKIYIKIPDTELERAPSALLPHLTDDREALAAAEPWIDDESNWSEEHNAALDQEIGPELDAGEHPFSWTPPTNEETTP